MLSRFVLLNRICAVIFFILFIFCFKTDTYFASNKAHIPFFGSFNYNTRLNIEPASGNYNIYFNDKKLKPVSNGKDISYSVTYANNYNLKSIGIEGDIEKMNNIALTSGDRFSYFSKEDILKFENKDGIYYLPKINKEGKYTIKDKSEKGILPYILSFFYNPVLYIFSYITLALFIFFLVKSGFNFKFIIEKPFAYYSIIFLIILSALILRMTDLSPPFWADELYTVYLASNVKLPFSSIFSDPGNPPFYYLLQKIWIYVFGDNETKVRMFSVICSVLSVYFLFRFISFSKTKESKFAAVFGIILISLNVNSIVLAQEARSYSLAVLLAIFLGYYLFNIIKNNKNYLTYGILSLCAINTHYFLSFILFSNFIYGLFYVQNKKKFILCNIISLFSFLPFIIMTGFNKGLMNDTFNIFEKPDLGFFCDIFTKFSYGNIISLIVILFVFLILFSKKTKCIFFPFNKEIQITVMYSFYTIVSVLVLSFLFSYIKPISRLHYYSILIPYFITIISFIPFMPYKKSFIKKLVIVLLFVGFVFPANYMKRERSKLTSFDTLIKFARNNSSSRVILVPYLPEVVKNAYGISKNEEIISHPLPLTADSLIETIKSVDNNTFYIRISDRKFIDKLLQFYETSFIVSDSDVIIARIKKRK